MHSGTHKEFPPTHVFLWEIGYLKNEGTTVMAAHELNLIYVDIETSSLEEKGPLCAEWEVPYHVVLFI